MGLSLSTIPLMSAVSSRFLPPMVIFPPQSLHLSRRRGSIHSEAFREASCDRGAIAARPGERQAIVGTGRPGITMLSLGSGWASERVASTLAALETHCVSGLYVFLHAKPQYMGFALNE